MRGALEAKPPETKYSFGVAPSVSVMLTTPGVSSAIVGTWLCRMPNTPSTDGTSTISAGTFS